MTFDSFHAPQSAAPFIVESAVMRDFMHTTERVARHSGAVLILGETGTGKETIAHLIHDQSLRSGKPFVDINCAALPEHLVESELFGYEKGAFSGAETAKPGLFELANSGTIFLDEIGELDLKVQVKLLRVLDRSPYYRLGGHRKIASDVRVVAATNRDLKAEVRAGRFRKDLYHRLSQFELCVPPLCVRPEDIAALAKYLLERDSPDHCFTPEAVAVLQTHSWPGNVRELQNTVNKLALHSAHEQITAEAVEQHLSMAGDDVDADQPARVIREMEVETEFDVQAIRKALQKTGGHRGQAAVELGISRRTLSRKLRTFGFSSKYGGEQIAAMPDGGGRQSYRAELSVPVVLCTPDGLEFSCRATNLSETGIGIDGLAARIGPHTIVRVRFQLPESSIPLTMTARPAWDDKRGGVGLLFTGTHSSALKEVRRWLLTKMADEGWDATDTLPVSSAVTC